jgi:tropinone reductase I
VLVNNVGGNRTLPPLDYDATTWRNIFETNLFSAWELSRGLHPLLAAHGAAAIVNLGSVSGQVHVRSGAPYGMSKAALHQMTRNLAANGQATASASTRSCRGTSAPAALRTRSPTRTTSTKCIDRTPLGRIGTPEEVAAAAAFLCLPAAAYITGQCLAVDGGFLASGF